MQALLLSLAFLTFCIGVAVVTAVIPMLLSISRRNDEVRAYIGVQTQIIVNRYNALNKPKADTKPNVYPIRGKDGNRQDDTDRPTR